jgi:exoribonuclease-2
LTDEFMKELSLGAKVERDDGAQGTMTFSTKLSPNGKVMDSAVRMGGETDSSRLRCLERHWRTEWPGQCPVRNAQDIVDRSAEDVEDLRLIQKFASACRSQRLRQAGLEYSNPTDISFKIITDIPAGPDNYFDLAQLPAKVEGRPR